MPVERREKERSGTTIFLPAIGLAFTLLAASLLLLSIAPYELCVRLARLATGSQDPLTRAAYLLLVRRLLPGWLFYGALGLSLLLFRERFAVWCTEAIEELRGCVVWHRLAIAETVRAETRLHLVSLTLIVLLGILLRVAYLGEPPRFDESATYLDFASRSIVHVLTWYPTPNNHVLHSLLAWVSCRIFGNSLWALRMPVLVAGVVLLPLLYAMARRLGGRNAGLYATGLAAVSGPLILYSVSARGYMLQAIFLVVMLYLATELATGAPGGSWVLFSAAAAAGFWTSPTMLYSYLLAVVWLLWHSGARLLRPVIVSGAATAAAVVALYMPIVIVSGAANLLANPWVQPLPAEEFWLEARRFPSDLLGFLHGGDPLPVSIALGLGVVLGLICKGHHSRYRPYLLVVLLLVLLAVPPIQRIVPFPRVLLPLLTVYYLSAAIGWSVLDKGLRSREPLMLIALLALAGSTAFHLTRSGYMEAQRYYPSSYAVASFLAKDLHPCDRLIISLSAGPPLVYELHRAGVADIEQYTNVKADSGRVLVAMSHRNGTLPPRGNGLLHPDLLTLEGTLRQANLNPAEYTPSRLIYASGEGEVLELKSRQLASARATDCRGR